MVNERHDKGSPANGDEQSSPPALGTCIWFYGCKVWWVVGVAVEDARVKFVMLLFR